MGDYLARMAGLARPKLRELDPATQQRVIEGAFVSKFIGEVGVTGRKCAFYAESATDDAVKKLFAGEVRKLEAFKRTLEEYREGMTRD
ncbi:MAG TPA: hypothetical protein VLK32_07115 [Bacillota bacterium]|nr:hypothetical protein [Bacillota bacterium]